MKFRLLAVALIIAVSAVASLAQAPVEAQEAPGVVVIKAVWAQQQYYEESSKPPRMEAPAREPYEPEYRQTRRPEDPRRSNPNGEPSPMESKQRQTRDLARVRPAAPSLGKVHKGFLYEVEFQNTGDKTIKVIKYDYVFIDPNSQQVVSSHQFQMENKLSRGKTRKSSHFSTTPPTRVVSAASPAGNAFIEKVIINRIEYSDGTVWERK
jgi:hypothetical protein